MSVSVIIPALNEEETIADVVRNVPREIASEIIVVDNGSNDRTAERARAAGARVVAEPRHGYGRACAAGVRARGDAAGILRVAQADHRRICVGRVRCRASRRRAAGCDFVIGSRTRGEREACSLNFQQVFAGRIAGLLVQLRYGVRYTDMCPFRAIRYDALAVLGMQEETYGWNLEMQMRAARADLRVLEVPVNHRRRAGGKSKVSGTLRGTFLAGTRILATFARVALERR